MRVATAVALLLVTMADAAAQTPLSETGARPGNVIGTGMSLPLSNKAGNLDAATTHSELAPNLPAPRGQDDIRSLMAEARDDLTSGQTGAAQEALERTETRALDRSVPVGTERMPAQGSLIAAVTQARGALAAGNTSGAIAIIDSALRQP